MLFGFFASSLPLMEAFGVLYPKALSFRVREAGRQVSGTWCVVACQIFGVVAMARGRPHR